MPKNIKRKQRIEKGGVGEIYFQADKYGIQIVRDDFITTKMIPDSSVDLIVTSPPYNVDIHYNSHKDNITFSEYLDFTRQWLKKAYEVAKDDGRICLNIPLDKNKGGQQSVYSDILQIAKECRWKYHSTIVWNEGNISRRTAWGSYMSASAPYVIAPVELITVLYKKQWKKQNRGESDIKKEEFIAWTNGLWTFAGESKKRVGHPAPFPTELPRRCIKLFSYVNDLILDPFLGSGTTLIACGQENRRGIGVEIDEEYCELAKKRIISEVSSHPWRQTDILLSRASQNVLLATPDGASNTEPAPWLDFSDRT